MSVSIVWFNTKKHRKENTKKHKETKLMAVIGPILNKALLVSCEVSPIFRHVFLLLLPG